MVTYQNYAAECYDDLKQIYHTSAEKYEEKTLFMQKRGRQYEEISYRRYCNDVDALGTALLKRGWGGRHVMIVGENCYEWVAAFMAVICGVGVVVPVDPGLSSQQIANIARLSDASAVIFSSALADRIDTPALASLEKIRFCELSQWISRGQECICTGDRSYLDAELDPGCMSLLLFTSGTTGLSRGVMLSHRNLCFNLSEMCKMVYIDDSDIFLSILPLHHAYECTCGFLCPLYRGATVAFGEGVHHLSRNMQQVHPTVMLCVPLLIERLYEKICANVRACGLEGSVRTGIRMTNSIGSEKLRNAARKKLFAEIHQSFGGSLRLLISGGATADPQTLQGMREFGFLVLQGYGLTECAPLVAINRDTAPNDRAAGMCTPNTLLDICDMQNEGFGEVRFQGDNLMLGYYKRPDLTAEVIRNGWFYTGDLGYLDTDGFLYITGRKQNAIPAENGELVYPEELEAYLNRSAYIRESVVVGYPGIGSAGRQIVAILHPDFGRMEAILGKNISSERFDLEMKKAVSEVNSALPPHKHIRAYLISEEAFPKNTSRKIKRAGLADLFYEQYREKQKSKVT